MKLPFSSLLFFATIVLRNQLSGALLEPGIVRRNISLSSSVITEPFTRSAYNGTQIEIRLFCNGVRTLNYYIAFVVRSSACDKEFMDLTNTADKSSRETWLNLYWTGTVQLPAAADYHTAYMYSDPPQPPFKGPSWRLQQCGDPVLSGSGLQWKTLLLQPAPSAPKTDDKPTNIPASNPKLAARRKRESIPDPTANNDPKSKPVILSADDKSLRTWHPAVTLKADAIYLLLIKITAVEPKPDANITIEVHWKGPNGYLSAIDYPLLPFYGIMCGVYALFAVYWLVTSAMQWKDLLRVQFWIGGVIFLGMLEKAVFCAEYETMNRTGESVSYAIQMAEIVSCLKKTLARMLVIIVSVGFGVVKPRLGSTLHKVVGVGFMYFILCSIESISRAAKVQHEGAKQKQLIGLPLTLLDVGICWWIFSSLLNTMRALRLRRNETKLWLYRHFTNTLIFAVLASLVFMIWSIVMHTFTRCLKDWKELWVDTAFWHLLFCVILMVILLLFRPTKNNQRYAFSPLLDAADDDDDDDEEDVVFNEAFTDNDAMKIRNLKTPGDGKKDKDGDASLEDELKWVEDNIPSSLTDKALPALVDSDEEREQTRYEISKMQ